MKHLPYLIATCLFALVLSACAEDRVESTFTASLEPTTLQVLATESGTVRVVIRRSGGFTAPVVVTLLGETRGVEADPLTITGGEGTMNIRVSDAAQVGTTYLTVQAEGGSVTRKETLTLSVGTAVARAAAVEVEGGSRQVRQGRATVRVNVTGSNLERVTSVKLSTLAITVVTSSSESLELRVEVPHGAPIGLHDLVLTSAGGDTTFPGALEVTPVTSGPAGNDATGAGTPEAPFRTLTRALSVASAGDTVRLLNGTYSAATGEQWPQLTPTGPQPGPNVPLGVGIEGETRAGVVLDGAGAAGNRIGLAFGGDGGARKLTVRGFALGGYVGAGEVVINDALFTGNTTGVGTDGGSFGAQDSDFSRNTETGILATGTATVSLLGGGADHNGEDGVRLGDGAPLLALSDFRASGNVNGVALHSNSSAFLSDTVLRDNQLHGLTLDDDAAAVVTDSDVSANGQGGIWMSAAQLKLRGTTVKGNGDHGVYVDGAPLSVDLGTFSDPGENDLDGNGPNGISGHLMDVRPDRPGIETPVIFTVSRTLIGGQYPTPDVYVGLHIDPLGFSVLGTNNVIQIY